MKHDGERGASRCIPGGLMGDFALPPVGKRPAGSGPVGPSGGGSGPAIRPDTSSSSSPRQGARPTTGLLIALWGLFAFGIVSVAWGFWSWSADRFDWRLQVAAALIAFFASVVVLALLRVDLNRRRSSGALVERLLTSSRTTTTVALISWSCGIAHVALVALELTSGRGA